MNKYIDLLKLKIKGYLVVDDFFPKEICTKMRYDALNHHEYMPMKKTYTTYWNCLLYTSDAATNREV